MSKPVIEVDPDGTVVGRWEEDAPACPACGTVLRHARVEGGSPGVIEPGVLIFCYGCGHLMVLDAAMRPRDLTRREADWVESQPDVFRRVRAVQAEAAEKFWG